MNRTRGILASIVLLSLLVLRMPLLAVLILCGWACVEGFLISKIYGKKGYYVFSTLMGVFLLFLTYQSFVFRSNLELIADIKDRGASSAEMSGNLIPGVVNYISLGPNVSDSELESILELDGLEGIELIVAKGSQITDRGLMMLHNCKQLERIYIDSSKVSDVGIAQLKRELPNCNIVYDMGH